MNQTFKLQARLRRVGVVLCCALSLFVFAPETRAQGGSKRKVTDAIMGIRIGTKLEEAQRKLKKRGTVGGRDTRDGGRKEAWTMKGTDYVSIAYKTDGEGRVVWVTGFLRPNKTIAFERLGDLRAALGHTQMEAFWNVETPEGGFRLVAKGSQGRAHVIYLLALGSDPD